MTMVALRPAAHLFLILISISLSSSVFCEEAPASKKASAAPNFPYKTIQTKEGLVFRVPEDMPIEMKNGIQAPLPFDEYVYGKFASFDSRLLSLEQKLNRIEQKLDQLMPLVGASVSREAAKKEEAQGILKAGIQ